MSITDALARMTAQLEAEKALTASLLDELNELKLQNQAPVAATSPPSPSALDVAGVLAVLDKIEDRAKVNAVHASGGVLDLIDQLRERLATGG